MRTLLPSCSLNSDDVTMSGCGFVINLCTTSHETATRPTKRANSMLYSSCEKLRLSERLEERSSLKIHNQHSSCSDCSVSHSHKRLSRSESDSQQSQSCQPAKLLRGPVLLVLATLCLSVTQTHSTEQFTH
mmetsp:Transcript_18984/g.31648  ORF Transcript_18984/g.31648 Transcript_18984/m.31648 type:complete len:131 (+) Transcript_18984:731-1123(+)